MNKSCNIDDKQDAALKVATAREDLFNWNQRLNGPMSNTCEQIADDARLEYLTSRMIQDEDGKRIWDDYSDFLTEKNQALAMRARFEVMLYLQGLDSDFLEKTPEAQAIREIEAEIQTKATEALAELEKSREEVKKDKPKVTRKRRTKKELEAEKSKE